MADLGGGEMEDDGAGIGDAERRGGARAEGALPGARGSSPLPSGAAEPGEGSSIATDRSAGDFTPTTSSAGVFPAKFSSFPGSIAPAPAPRLVPSLFPSSTNFGAKQAPQGVPSWLSNSSFSENLLPPPSISAGEVIEQLCGKDVRDEIEEREGKGERARVETPSSSSDSDATKGDEGERSRHRRRKEKRRRKRRREEKEEGRKRRKERKGTGDDLQIGSLEGQSVDRKAAVKAWADGKSNVAKEYYVDTRGDRDNLAFGSLYRMDVARYFRQQVDGGEREGTRRRNATYLDVPEPDGDVQENKEYRYWSGEAMALETRRDFRRIRIHPLRPSATTINDNQDLETFIPLRLKKIKKKGEGEDDEEEGESWNDYITRRTREFNALTRERPGDENSWLEFAKFQDELVHMAQRKGVKQQAVEKKISVLEKALEHHPHSLQLMLMHLEACSLRDTVPEMLAKWEKAVILHSGSYRFWKEFLLFVCSQFSLFSVPTVRVMYVRALGALTAARDRLKNEDAGSTTYTAAELAMVAILADRCHFELQTGHAELGLAIFQAAIEYSLFAPLIQTSENNKRRLFEAFWDSQALRIGEEGALGWALWLEREEEELQRAKAHETAQEVQEPGGWTGWFEPVVPSSGLKMDDDSKSSKSGADPSSVEEYEDEEVGVESDEDEATLLAKLGMSSMDAGKDLEVTDPRVWSRWAVEEKERGAEQWLPLHARTNIDEEQDEQLERVVMFEDIRNILVSISSEEGLCLLIGHFLEFCNIPLSNWCSSNDLSLKQGIEGLDSLTSSLSRLRGIRSIGITISQYLAGDRRSQDGGSGEIVLRSLVGDLEWFLHSHERAQFVCNALLLLQSCSFSSLKRRHWELTELLLAVQCISSDNGVKASRNLAKKLLKTHRQDIALWTAYALVEGAAGHIDTARKVFDTTLSSLLALPNELRDDAPLLYLACADMEMSYGSKIRALYILCHFGAGISYAPSDVDDPVSPTLILKAKLGFQQYLQNVRRARTYIRDTAAFNSKPTFGGALDERGVAVIACVGLFEELSSGWKAAVSVFEESLAFTLPGKWKESKECEALMERYVSVLRRNVPPAKPAQVRRVATRGLVEYPHNSVLLEMLVQSSSSSYNLRRYFDDSVKRNPSTLLWMFSLATELTKEGNSARIRSLFERALEMKATQHSVLLWRTYLAYEYEINQNIESARRIYFRAIHACPWSKKLWLDGFTMLSSVLTAKQLAEFQEIMRDKELRIRTDVYEILLQDAEEDS